MQLFYALFFLYSFLLRRLLLKIKEQLGGGAGAQGVPSETGRKRLSVWVLGVLLSCLSFQALLRSQSPEPYPSHSRHLWVIASKPRMSGSREMKSRGRRLSINALWAKWENRSVLCSGFKDLLLLHTWSVKLFVTQIFSKRCRSWRWGLSSPGEVDEAKIAPSGSHSRDCAFQATCCRLASKTTSSPSYHLATFVWQRQGKLDSFSSKCLCSLGPF